METVKKVLLLDGISEEFEIVRNQSDFIVLKSSTRIARVNLKYRNGLITKKLNKPQKDITEDLLVRPFAKLFDFNTTTLKNIFNLIKISNDNDDNLIDELIAVYVESIDKHILYYIKAETEKAILLKEEKTGDEKWLPKKLLLNNHSVNHLQSHDSEIKIINKTVSNFTYFKFL